MKTPDRQSIVYRWYFECVNLKSALGKFFSKFFLLLKVWMNISANKDIRLKEHEGTIFFVWLKSKKEASGLLSHNFILSNKGITKKRKILDERDGWWFLSFHVFFLLSIKHNILRKKNNILKSIRVGTQTFFSQLQKKFKRKSKLFINFYISFIFYVKKTEEEKILSTFTIKLFKRNFFFQKMIESETQHWWKGKPN